MRDLLLRSRVVLKKIPIRTNMPFQDSRIFSQFLQCRKEQYDKYDLLSQATNITAAEELQKPTLIVACDVSDEGEENFLAAKKVTVSSPGSEVLIPTELEQDIGSMSKVLSHIKNVKDTTYADICSFVKRPGFRGKEVLSFLNNGGVDHIVNTENADFYMSTSVPTNIIQAVTTAKNNGAKQIVVRPDLMVYTDTPSCLFSMKSSDELQLLTDEVRDKNGGFDILQEQDKGKFEQFLGISANREEQLLMTR